MNATAREARRVAQNRRRVTLAIACAASVIVGLISGMALMVNDDWSTGNGPAMQKLEVRAYGFVGKDGRWRSYDTGEPIEVLGYR